MLTTITIGWYLSLRPVLLTKAVNMEIIIKNSCKYVLLQAWYNNTSRGYSQIFF